MNNKLNPRDIIEAARAMARKSRDMMLPELQKVYGAMPDFPLGQEKKQELLLSDLQIRMNLVMDCYLTGCAEMLKRLHGDDIPETWSDEYDHEKRLTELLGKYGLL